MANNPGAKKRIRQNAVRRLRNRYRISTARTYIKRLKSTTENSEAEALLPMTFRYRSKSGGWSFTNFSMASKQIFNLQFRIFKDKEMTIQVIGLSI